MRTAKVNARRQHIDRDLKDGEKRLDTRKRKGKQIHRWNGVKN